MLRINLVFLLMVLLFSCSPKFTEYNSSGFGGGFASSKMSNHNVHEIRKLSLDCLVDDSVDSCALLSNQPNLLGTNHFVNMIHPSDIVKPKNLQSNVKLNSEQHILKQFFTPKSSLKQPFFQKILNRQKQPRKTILIIVGIGILLGLLGSIVGLFNLLIGRTDIGGIIIGLSLAFAVLMSLILALFDLDVILGKLKQRGIKTANDFFKIMGIYLLRLAIVVCFVILIFLLALSPLFIR